jgi:adenosylcobinamide-GDP ribazoletransferase
MRVLQDILIAFQFLTRLPLGRLPYEPNALSRSAKFFPVVGLVVGAAAAVLYRGLIAHLPSTVAALLVVTFLTLITGGLHEDGLADVADAFGGGWSREKIFQILKDSRIGAFGAIAIVLSIGLRTLLLGNLPLDHFAAYVISSQVLCRWTALPLAYALPAAEPSSQGARIARQVSGLSLAIGTIIAIAVVGYMLRGASWCPLISAALVTSGSGLYYWRRIGSITGDCFGATNQLAEIAVYLCGVWR